MTLELINWWPRNYRRRCTNIFTLSVEEIDTDLSVMALERDRAYFQRRTPCRFRGQTPRFTHRHHPRTHYRQSTRRYIPPLPTDEDTDELSPSAIATLNEDIESTINAPADSTIRSIFHGCTFIDASHLPPDDPHYFSRHSKSSARPSSYCR